MNTKHSESCKMVFGRKDMTCSRCVELANGAAPRAWFNTRAKSDALRIRDIRAHVCSPKCGPVCTFGDW